MSVSLSRFAIGCVAIALILPPLPAGPPVQVKIQDEKTTTEENVLPLDPVKRVIYQPYAGMGVQVRIQANDLMIGQLSTVFKIDGQVVYANQFGGRQVPMPIPNTPSGKPRDGHMQSFQLGALHLTQTVEVTASKPPRAESGSKRLLDTVLIRYTIENKDTQSHQVGTRVMSNTVLKARTALFAAPNQPGKILNGVELKDANVPDYLQIIQNADLKNPGLIAYMTHRLNRKWEAPNRVVLTRIGAPTDGFNINALPAGNSALAIFWDPAEIKAGGKRELACAYGGGIAVNPEGEGHVALALSGSFEPGKLFTVTAEVDDPAPGQHLTLELPSGMQRVEGKERQPVPLASEDNRSVVVWKARVLQMGEYRLRVRSSAGTTLTKLISINPAQ